MPSIRRFIPLPRTLRRQFILALSLQALLIIGGAVMAIYALRLSAETSRQLAEGRLELMQQGQSLVEKTLLIERESYRILKADSLDELRSSFAESIKQVGELDSLIDGLGQATNDIKVLSLHQSGQLFRNSLSIVVKLLEKTLRPETTPAARSRIEPRLHNYHHQLQNKAVEMVDAAHVLSARFSAEYRDTITQLNRRAALEQRHILVFFAGSLLLAWLVSRFFLGRQVVDRLQQVSFYLRSDEIGDESAAIPVHGHDEIGEMARAVEQFLENRRQLAATRDSLRQSEEMLRTVIEAAPAAIIGLDLEGRVQSVWNKAAEQMLGWQASEVMGKPLPTVAVDDQEEFRRFREQIRQGLNLEGQEVQRQRRDGSLIDYCIYASPLHGVNGEIAGNIAVLVDITTRKLLENEIRQRNSELEEAYAELKAAQSKLLQQEKMVSIGQLAAGVAHEINNPMGFILSNLGTLDKYLKKLLEFQQIQQQALEGEATDLSARREEVVRQRKNLKIDFLLEDIDDLIRESLDGGERVKKIVLNLKGFARIDEEEWGVADINEGLESTLNIVWNEIKDKAEVKRDFGEIPLTLCNISQLNQVFMNLLLNAAQAIAERGEIRVATRQEGEETILIEIADDGCGIPNDKLSRIFDPFYTSKDVGMGTGLGLSIVYDIVKEHDGEVSVVSEPGQGTTFSIRLPIRVAEASAESLGG